MAEINRVTLFGKLNQPTYKAGEGATVFCKLRGNPYVELEHFLAQQLQSADSDWHRVIKHTQLDMSALAKDLTTALDRLPRGATSISGIAENIADSIERGWVYGTLLYGDSVVRSCYMLVGMLKTKRLRDALVAISRQFEKLKVEELSDNLPKIIAGSPEDGQGARKLKSYILAGGEIEIKPRTSGRRISSCMPIQAPKLKPATHVVDASGWKLCTQSSAAAASDS